MFERRTFLPGLVCGVLLVFGGRLVINHTPFADWAIAPLLVPDSAADADVIVALGAGVVGECRPNRYGTERTLQAIKLWRAGRAPRILFSGGSARHSCPVARAMAGLAEELGVPAASLLVETFAKDTWENAARSRPVLETLGARRVVLVTDRLHMRRAAGSFARIGVGVEPVSVPIFIGHADNVSMLQAGIREYLALAYYAVRGWAEGPPPGDAAPPAPVASMTASDGHEDGPLVILGASYAKGWSVPALAGVRIVNQGRAGERSVEMAARFERDVIAARPRAVILWGLVNDITQAGVDVAAAVANVRESYTTMIARARAAGIEPILATEVGMGRRGSWSEYAAEWVGWLRGRVSYQARVNEQVRAANQSLVELARREGLLVLDFHSVLAGPRGMRRPEFTQEDGSHLTDTAYRALTEFAEPVLERHLGQRP
jgi:uncharacterized SAM-binding protein YcdF (DUF218 family)/lysophospholipase L1-like esterase